MEHSSKHLRAAVFTLEELLVVIGILALLISKLLPALNRSKSQVAQTQCVSNLWQIGISIVAYVNENRGHVLPTVV